MLRAGIAQNSIPVLAGNKKSQVKPTDQAQAVMLIVNIRETFQDLVSREEVNSFHVLWSIAVESPTENKMTAKAWTTYLKMLKEEIEVIHHALGKDVVSIDNVSFK